MHKYRLELVTTADILEFVKIAAETDAVVRLTDSSGLCVNGKSLLGAMATVEWNSLYCLSDEDIYSRISRFVKQKF